MLVLEGLVGLYKTHQLQLLQHYWSGIDLEYCDIEWFALKTNRDNFVIFEIASKYCISEFLLSMRATPFFEEIAHSSRYDGHLS